MNNAKIKTGSLVLYKNGPAIVQSTGEKIEIKLAEKGTRRVRLKDVVLLHPGSVTSHAELRPVKGEIEQARELLEGETTTLEELAELAFDEFTPATAWASWQVIADGVHFTGTPDAVIARSAEEVARETQVRAEKSAKKQAKAAFFERVESKRLEDQDRPKFAEVEKLARGQVEKCRLMKELGREEDREHAHALLLELGLWDETQNPYPARYKLPMKAPDLPVPELRQEERIDLTHLDAFAIDDEGNQDPDDALSIDGDRVWVHVADVAALAPPESDLDAEARGYGANLYLPEGTISMLPDAARAALGLGLHEISPALSFGFRLSESGELDDVEIVRSQVRVTRMTYAEAEQVLDQNPLSELKRLSEVYEQRRLANGATRLELPEVKIRVVDGEVTIQALAALKSRNLVMEAMLMAGEAAAQFAIENDLPFPFTTQAAPEEVEHPETLAEMYAYRRKFKPSQMKSSAGSHFGLGLEKYTRATSPLRRYLDLVAHQQLRAFISGETPLSSEEIVARVGAAEAVSGGVRRAERLSNRHWTLVYLLRNPGWEGEGILVEKRHGNGVFLIPELGFEATLHLPRDFELNARVPLKFKSANLPELTARFGVSV